MEDKNRNQELKGDSGDGSYSGSYDQNLLYALLDSSSDHIYFKDLESRFIRVSQALARRHGLSAKEMIGKTDFDFFGPIHAQQAFDDEQQIIKTLEPIIGKEEFEDSQDGKFTWVTTSKMPLFDLSGKVIGTFGISRDITRRKRAENVREALFEISEAVYTASDMYNLYQKIHEVVGKLMPAKNFYIALYDENNQMLSFPYFVDEYDSLQPPKKVGRGLTEYVLRLGKPALIDAQTDLNLRLQGEVDLVGAPEALWLGVPLKVADRTIGIIVIQDYENVNAFGEEEVQILTFVAAQVAQAIERRTSSEDIKRYAEELKKINNAKDKFISIISHDLRGPLNGLLSFSEILLEDFASQSESDKELFIENLQSSMKILLSLTETLLTWSQLQSNGIKVDPARITLQELIKSVLRTQLLFAKNKGVLLECNCVPEIEVFADSNMIETVIRNLVSNALKFTKKGGSVSVNAKVHDSKVVVEVVDTGIGMNSELTEKLFRIDTKVTREGTQKEKGTGLGLVICKEFVERNGGTISVQSQINAGTTFSITLKSAEGKR